MVGLSLARSARGQSGPNYVLCAVGVALLLAGMFVNGLADAAALALLVLGAAIAVLGLIMGRLTEFELGPTGLKTKLSRDDVDFRPVFFAESERLQRFAKLMCGDGEQAREAVEDALVRTRQQHRVIPADQRAAFALRTLITLLETAPVRSWLHGERRPPPSLPADSAEVMASLGELDVHTRAAFILHFDWALGYDELAGLLGRPRDELEAAVKAAEAAIGP